MLHFWKEISLPCLSMCLSAFLSNPTGTDQPKVQHETEASAARYREEYGCRHSWAQGLHFTATGTAAYSHSRILKYHDMFGPTISPSNSTVPHLRQEMQMDVNSIVNGTWYI